MTESEKCQQGILYDASDPQMYEKRLQSKDLCFAFNQLRPSQTKEREELLSQIVGKMGKKVWVESPFYCDYGTNITLGDGFYANHGLILLDPAPIFFGNHVLVGPNCGFYTAGHPLDWQTRRTGQEYAHPIQVEDDVWIGGHVCVLPGVTIGRGSVIAAGSVVNRDIPPYTLAGGNPCRVIRSLVCSAL